MGVYTCGDGERERENISTEQAVIWRKQECRAWQTRHALLGGGASWVLSCAVVRHEAAALCTPKHEAYLQYGSVQCTCILFGPDTLLLPSLYLSGRTLMARWSIQALLRPGE